MTRNDIESDRMSGEWPNDPFSPVPVGFGVISCHVYLLGSLLGDLGLPGHPHSGHLRCHKHSQSGPKWPKLGTPGGRHSPWVVWTSYGALGPAGVACVGGGAPYPRHPSSRPVRGDLGVPSAPPVLEGDSTGSNSVMRIDQQTGSRRRKTRALRLVLYSRDDQSKSRPSTGRANTGL